MAESLTSPVDNDAVPKVDNAVAIGEDLEFQERWWKFERVLWTIFSLILLADVLGVFGRGWLAKAKVGSPENGMYVDYERVARAGTPSIMDIHFAPDSVTRGAIHLFVSDTLVKQLGTQRVVPQPQSSSIGDGGISYTFPATGTPAEVQLEMQPSFPGVHRFTLQVEGKTAVDGRVVVVP